MNISSVELLTDFLKIRNTLKSRESYISDDNDTEPNIEDP